MAWFSKSRHQKRRGVLTLEWVLLVTVIIIGIIDGLGAVRNATNGELLDLAEASGSRSVLMISHDELPEGVVHARYRLVDGKLIADSSAGP